MMERIGYSSYWWEDLDKLVLVTGASRGIGKAIAVEFAKSGYDVALNARRVENLREVSKEVQGYGRGVLELGGDVGKPDDVAKIFRTVEEEVGYLDVLVNNAGIQSRYGVETLPVEEWDRVINVNLRGAVLCIKHAVRLMENRRNPSVINITSVHETLPKPYYIHYSASKGGLGMVTKTLALELARKGIRVNAIAPGAIETSMNRELLEDEAKLESVRRMIPLGRLGKPEEIAYVAVFLASDKASYITGATIYIDGGLRLCNQMLTEP